MNLGDVVMVPSCRPTNPLDLITTSGYNAVGRKTLKLDPRGEQITYVFDAAGRESGRLYSDGSRVTTTYDPVGNRLVVADSTGRYTRTYDADNLTTSVTNPDTNRLTFIYDALRRREVVTVQILVAFVAELTL